LLMKGTSAAETFTVNATTITLSGGTITYTNAESVTLNGLSGADTYNIDGTAAGTPVTVQAPGVAFISVNETAPGAPVIISALSGPDTVNVNTDNPSSAEALLDIT